MNIKKEKTKKKITNIKKMMKEDDEYEDYSKKNKEDKKYIVILKRQLRNCRFERGYMPKRRFPKKNMRWSREILILIMFVNIKEVYPRERNLKG